jgi:hypothetical protein
MSHDGRIWGKNESEDKRSDYEDRTQNTKKKKNTEKKDTKEKIYRSSQILEPLWEF